MRSSGCWGAEDGERVGDVERARPGSGTGRPGGHRRLPRVLRAPVGSIICRRVMTRCRLVASTRTRAPRLTISREPAMVNSGRRQGETDVGVRQLGAQPVDRGLDEEVVVEGQSWQVRDVVPRGVVGQLAARQRWARGRGSRWPARGLAGRGRRGCAWRPARARRCRGRRPSAARWAERASRRRWSGRTPPPGRAQAPACGAARAARAAPAGRRHAPRARRRGPRAGYAGKAVVAGPPWHAVMLAGRSSYRLIRRKPRRTW